MGAGGIESCRMEERRRKDVFSVACSQALVGRIIRAFLLLRFTGEKKKGKEKKQLSFVMLKELIL